MQYQNIFTRVQVHGGPDLGMPQLKYNDLAKRGTKTRIVHLFGRIGDAQVGPVYLGWLGLLSIIMGTLAFNIMGINMLSQVNWDLKQFVRQLFWLALEPPSPAYGLRIPPLNEGGWYMIAGFLLTGSILLWWGWERTSLGLLRPLSGSISALVFSDPS
jgi:photosynthetic reaction center M subunit